GPENPGEEGQGAKAVSRGGVVSGAQRGVLRGESRPPPARSKQLVERLPTKMGHVPRRQLSLNRFLEPAPCRTLQSTRRTGASAGGLDPNRSDYLTSVSRDQQKKTGLAPAAPGCSLGQDLINWSNRTGLT